MQHILVSESGNVTNKNGMKFTSGVGPRHNPAKHILCTFSCRPHKCRSLCLRLALALHV